MLLTAGAMLMSGALLTACDGGGGVTSPPTDPDTRTGTVTTDTEGQVAGPGSTSGDGHDNGGGDDARIVVLEPAPLDVVVDEIRLRGTARVYEGNVRYRLEDAKDRQVLAGAVQATCGAPCEGKFDTTIKLDGVPPGNYSFFVFDEAAEEGSEPFEVYLPLTVHAKR